MLLLQNKIWKILAALVLLVNIVSGFGIRLFSSGFSLSTGLPTTVVFTGNYPKLVTFKIGVIDEDNTLTSLEEFNAYNFRAGDFQTVNIPNNIRPGINYYFIAVDNDHSSNYATLGPLVIEKTNSGLNPSAIITAQYGGVEYKTNPPNNFTITGVLVVLMIIFSIFLYKRCFKRQTLGYFTLTYTENADNALSQPNNEYIPIGATIIELSGPNKSGVNLKKVPLSPQKTKQSPDTDGIKDSLPTSSKENALVPPYPHQQDYPSYHDPQDLNFSGDHMPIPEHFNNTNQPYSPKSPTIQNSINPSQPQYPVYNSQQGSSSQQYVNPFIAGEHPTMTDSQGDKNLGPSFAET